MRCLSVAQRGSPPADTPMFALNSNGLTMDGIAGGQFQSFVWFFVPLSADLQRFAQICELL